MKTKIIEVTNGPRNWGKFALCRFDSEWEYESKVGPGFKLLAARGWSREHLLVLDLETGEGAMFRPGGYAAYDLDKHAIWVCPMYQPLLEWLYKQDLSDLDRLPDTVDLPDAEFLMQGHRRPGPPPKVTVIEHRVMEGGSFGCDVAHIASSPEAALEWIKRNKGYGPKDKMWWWGVYEEEVDSPTVVTGENLRFYDPDGNPVEQGAMLV